jgi:hypothetical protein
MRWLEIIEIRASGKNLESLHKQLQGLADEVNGNPMQQKAKIYTHVSIDNDLSIHLLSDSDRADANGSVLGQQIAAMLRSFGLINHSIWIEQGGE